MTETKWLTCADPTPMLEFVRGKASDRNLRLLLCAFARQIMVRPHSRELAEAIRHAEEFADGMLSLDTLNVFRQERPLSYYPTEPQRQTRKVGDLVLCAKKLLWPSAQALCALMVRLRIASRPHDGQKPPTESVEALVWRERAFAAALIRDVCGTPFQGSAPEPGWMTANVTQIAEAIYDERAFDRLPILADALLDAGCTDEQILGHCRAEGPHVRGCWALDLLLGKG